MVEVPAHLMHQYQYQYSSVTELPNDQLFSSNSMFKKYLYWRPVLFIVPSLGKYNSIYFLFQYYPRRQVYPRTRGAVHQTLCSCVTLGSPEARSQTGLQYPGPWSPAGVCRLQAPMLTSISLPLFYGNTSSVLQHILMCQ